MARKWQSGWTAANDQKPNAKSQGISKRSNSGEESSRPASKSNLALSPTQSALPRTASFFRQTPPSRKRYEQSETPQLFHRAQRRKMRLFIPLSIHATCGAQRPGPTRRAPPDTRALLGRCSLSAWPGDRRRSRPSLPSPRRAWAGQPWLRRGQLFTTRIMSGGKVIHQPGRSDLRPSLPSLLNNFGIRIRVGGWGDLRVKRCIPAWSTPGAKKFAAVNQARTDCSSQDGRSG